VILPVYNGESYIAEAVSSVLAQTYGNFELVVVDDGSTDRTMDVLARFSDSRLRVLRQEKNLGIAPALNAGICQSRGELVARMDADDICLPRRFERQAAFLDRRPEVGLCGTWTRMFGNRASTIRTPEGHEQVRAALFFGFAMDHPSVMMRRSALDAHGLRYAAEFAGAEDLDLFLRASEVTTLANIPEVLLRTRSHRDEESVAHFREATQTAARVLIREVRALLPEATEDDASLHFRLLFGEVDADGLARAGDWWARLERANLRTGRYDAQAFRRELTRHWEQIHARAGVPWSSALASYWWGAPAGGAHPGTRGGARIAARRAARALRQWMP